MTMTANKTAADYQTALEAIGCEDVEVKIEGRLISIDTAYGDFKATAEILDAALEQFSDGDELCEHLYLNGPSKWDWDELRTGEKLRRFPNLSLRLCREGNKVWINGHGTEATIWFYAGEGDSIQHRSKGDAAANSVSERSSHVVLEIVCEALEMVGLGIDADEPRTFTNLLSKI